MPPKIIFFDIDDTLYLKDRRRVPESACAALHQLKKQGIVTAIATGRAPAVLPQPIRGLMQDAGIEMLVSINGQYVEYKGKQLAAFPMPPEQAAEISGSLNRIGISHAFVSDRQISIVRINDEILHAVNALALPYSLDDQHYRHLPVYQMLAFFEQEQEAAVHSVLPESVKTIRWHRKGADLIDRHGSKARGIQAALSALGLDMADAMAFGDGMNDLEMMEAVGFGVAMGNGCDELKAAADYVCPRADEDGIYRALTDLGVLQAA